MGTTPDRFEYEEAGAIAAGLVRDVVAAARPPADPGPLRAILGHVARRRFGELRRLVAPADSFERFVLEVFLTTRIRRWVLAYLSVQEGTDFDGVDTPETPVPGLIGQFLDGFARRPLLRLRHHRGIRFGLTFDPVGDLRRIYALVLRDEADTPRGRRLVRRHRARYRRKLRLFHGGVRGFVRLLVHRTPDPIDRLFRLEITSAVLRGAVARVFEDSSRFAEADWAELDRRVRAYFPARINALLEVIPADSLESHGLIKLFKVAVGVVAGRLSVRGEHEADPVDFVFNTLRAAYGWGVTYPLVDNVLDSARLSDRERSAMSAALLALFADGDGDGPPPGPARGPSPEVDEVLDRLRETLALVPRPRHRRAKAALRQLYAAHQRDSARRLDPDGTPPPDESDAVLVDTALKSALVRLATMELCGIDTDAATLREALRRGLYNQLGDDLWDIHEDHAERRVTPFTRFLAAPRPPAPDPFRLYLDLTRDLARDASPERARAAYLGFCETLRDFLDTARPGAPGGLDAEPHLRRLLREATGGSALADEVRSVPHVDFDALLFLGESAFLEMLGGTARLQSGPAAASGQDSA
jgi:hypothetical protein